MDKGAGDLNESLEEVPIRVLRAQPELFENVVRLIVFAPIEAREESLVVRIQRQVGLAPSVSR
jgi:hypothetical protein